MTDWIDRLVREKRFRKTKVFGPSIRNNSCYIMTWRRPGYNGLAVFLRGEREVFSRPSFNITIM